MFLLVTVYPRLGIHDIISVLQQNRLRWYGHVLRKEGNDWVKKCMVYEVKGSRPKGRPKRSWREVVVSWKRTVVQGGCYGSQQMEEVDKRMSDNQNGCE